MKKLDLTGQRFGRLTVVSPSPLRCYRNVVWHCRCDCGESTEMRGDHLRSGHSQSCGCLSRDRVQQMGTTNARHGHCAGYVKTGTYRSWRAAKNRTTNSSFRYWDNYGGRGIRMCPRWLDSFENFLADMGERPEGTTIDRINNDGDYEPGNCRWATPTEQQKNKRINRRADEKAVQPLQPC